MRGAIYAMQGRTCAYCQRVASDRRGDVEHFRPKATYRWLMYDYGNYFLSCRVCNSNRKNKTFPVDPENTRVDYEHRDRLAQEGRLLIDPGVDPVDGWIRVDYEGDACPMVATEAVADDPVSSARIAATIDFFFLNTDLEILTDRMQAVDETIGFAGLARGDDQTAIQILQDMAVRYRPHGAAVRQVMRELVPEIARPTAGEELEWFVAELVKSAAVGDGLLPDLVAAEREAEGDLKTIRRRQREDAEKKLDEGCWTLAVILYDPPGGVPAAIVEGWIRDGGGESVLHRVSAAVQELRSNTDTT